MDPYLRARGGSAMTIVTAISEDERLRSAIRVLAIEAGRAILQIYGGDILAATIKDDGSPVTAADAAAEVIILKGLRDLTPDIPVIAEEAHSAGCCPTSGGDRFWLVDPLDGTREFLNRSGEFTVNIALVEHGRSVLGVVHAPALGRTFCGRVGGGAMLDDSDQPTRTITARPRPAAGAVVVASRRHGDADRLRAFLADMPVAEEKCVGSSLKFCLIAAGEADIYPRFGRTMEWDTAAGHAVLNAAGGSVEMEDGAPLCYGKPGFENTDFIAFGRRS